MTKTIEEAAWNFARKQWGKQVPHTIDKIADMLIDFGNEVMAMPLSSRLTPEEKERVRIYHRLARDGYWECNCADKAVVKILESIFGADFFKEGE